VPDRWKIWIDTGGTFTDCLGVDPRGRLGRVKVLSSSALRGRVVGPDPEDAAALLIQADWASAFPEDGTRLFAGCRFRGLGSSGDGSATAGAKQSPSEPRETAVPILGVEALRNPSPFVDQEASAPSARMVFRGAAPAIAPGAVFELQSLDEAPVLAARLLTRTPQDRPLPPVELRLATTRGTNALLERKGAPTVLLVTRGFGDLLEIGDQARPELFVLTVDKPRPLYRRVIEVKERVGAGGTVLEPLDLDDPDLAAALSALGDDGIRSAAVALLHSFRRPEHERGLGEHLRRAGLDHVSLSSELAPLIKILPRAETAVVDAYLAPIIGGYLDRVREALPEEATLHVMTSAGGLVGGEDYRAKDSLLSGPAGGVVGAAEAARRSGFERMIGFDMGGTSTDVARVDGAYEYLFEHRVGDARLVAPALAIETVAAGGGSICRYAAGRLLVGPESAGASPGPACYGAGGPLTLTDVNLLLGRLDADRFGIPADRDAARRRLDELVAAVTADRGAEEAATGDAAPGESLLAGCLEIANERMADAVRRISLRRGYDPAEYALVAFGGAGGQHACSLAELLGMAAVIVPADAGLLSAVGLGAAVVERFAQRQVLEPLAAVADRLPEMLGDLADDALRAVEDEGVAAGAVEVRRRLLHLRLAGQESTLVVEPSGSDGSAEELTAAFGTAYSQLYGYPPPDRPIEVESVRVVASSRTELGKVPATETSTRAAHPVDHRTVLFAGGWRETAIYERESLDRGDALDGPALVFERHAATVVTPGWSARVDGAGNLLLERMSDE